MKKRFINDETVVFCVLSVFMIVYIILYLQFGQMSELAVSMSQFANRALHPELSDGNAAPAHVSEIAVDNSKCFIQIFGVDPEYTEGENEGCAVRLYFENRAKTALTYDVKLTGINGFACSDGIVSEVGSGHSKIAEMYIDKNNLDVFGENMEKFTDLEFTLTVCDKMDPYYVEIREANERMSEAELSEFKPSAEKPDDIYAGKVHVYPYGKVNATDFVKIRGEKEGDKVLLNNDDVTVTVINYTDEEAGIRLGFLVTNKTDKDITLDYDEVFVNGKKIDGEFALIDTFAGKTSYETFLLLPSALEENGIDEIKKIEFASSYIPETDNKKTRGTETENTEEDRYDVSDKKLVFTPEK